MNYVFVYGSLKSGFHNNDILSESELLVEDALTEPLFCMYDTCAGFPYIVDGTHCIEGEVYKVSNRTMDNLDILEGYTSDISSFYDRKKVTIAGYDCWVYFLHEKIYKNDPIVDVISNVQKWDV